MSNNGIRVRIELASRNVLTGDTLITYVLRYPRIIHGELLTHRAFSKNSASSRAVPCKTLRRLVRQDPFIPWHLGDNQKGMQAGAAITGLKYKALRWLYGAARYPAMVVHWSMEKAGLHKQIANRMLEPWMWMEVVLSATELGNFFSLRCHKDAEPHFQELAKEMRMLALYADYVIDEFDSGVKHNDIAHTQKLRVGEWHTPFAYEGTLEERKITSAARCARVSFYLPEDGKVSTFDKDQAIYERLSGSTPMHASPFEHVSMASSRGTGNYKGFKQLRHTMEKKAS